MKIETFYCEQGQGAANEDTYGCTGQFAWVIDGATDVFGCHCLSNGHEVREYVRCLSEALAACAQNYSAHQLPQLLTKASTMAYKQLNIEQRAANIPEYMLPTYAISLIAVEGNTLHYLILGDCFLGYSIENTVMILTDERLRRFSKQNRQLLTNYYEQNHHLPDSLTIYQDARSKANAPEGYPIGSVCGTGIPQALTGTLNLSQGQYFVMCSDGFLDYFRVKGVQAKRFLSPETIRDEINAANAFLADDSIFYKNLRPKKIDDRTLLLIEV